MQTPASKTSAQGTSTLTEDTDGRKRVAMFVTYGILTCTIVITVVIALLIAYLHLTKNEHVTDVVNATQPKGKLAQSSLEELHV